MPININDSQESSVTVILKVFPPIEEVWVEFARIPDVDVMRELEELCSRPGFSLFDYWKADLTYKVRYPSGWEGRAIAEAIAKCFEQDHGLVVSRLIQSVKVEENVKHFCMTS